MQPEEILEQSKWTRVVVWIYIRIQGLITEVTVNYFIKQKRKRHGNKFKTLTQQSLLNSVDKTLKIPVGVAQRHLWYFNDISL